MVTRENHDSKVKIQFENGVGADGRILKKSKTYAGIKAKAADDKVYEAVTLLTDLQEKPVMEVVRIEESVLING